MARYRDPIKPFLTFIDEPEEETPLSASNLNFIQNELKEALNGKYDKKISKGQCYIYKVIGYSI